MSEDTKQEIVQRIEERRKNAIDPTTYLKDIGAIQSTDDEQELEFTPSFASRLDEHIENTSNADIGKPELARLFGAEEDRVTKKDRPHTAWKIRHNIRNWPSEDALVFDVATDEALREVTDDWDEVPPKQRFRIVQSLRSFQDSCLFCDGSLVFSDNTVQSCCSERRVLTLHCDACDRRFLEFRAEGSDMSSVDISP